jgi:hypothetical protein
MLFFENSFHLAVEQRRVEILILQLEPDVAPELIIFGEYRYHRN